MPVLTRSARWLLIASMSTAVCSCREKPPPPPPPPRPAVALAVSDPAVPPPQVIPPGLEKWAWTARSRDYKATVQQTPKAPGQCEVKSTGGNETWTLNECLGDNTLMYFASGDGSGLLVIDPLPSFEKAWQTSIVVRLYRNGSLVGGTNAGAVVNDRNKLRMLTKRFAWLQGAGGLPGVAPQYVHDDIIMGKAVDGTEMRLGFSPLSLPRAMNTTEVIANQVLESGGVLTWTDDEGEMHFTNDPREVPNKYRQGVKRPIDGGIIGAMGGTK